MNMKYQCEICGKTFDFESNCKFHIDEHKYSDYYGKCFKAGSWDYFVPGGFILMNDGEYILSGIQITLTLDGCEMHEAHYPLENLKTMEVVRLEDIWASLGGKLAVYLNGLREETYREWAYRRLVE